MNTQDKWIKCIATSGNLVATAVTATNLIEEARRRHRTGTTEIKPLGEALMAGLLLASTCKSGERVSLSIKSSEFIRQAFVDALPLGTVRGFIVTRDRAVTNHDYTLGPWQQGTLSVARLKQNEPEPYIGTVPIVTGHLAKDVTFYLSQSEQIPSAVGLAVNVNENSGEIESAGAFLVQVLPGATTEQIQSLEQNISNLESLAAQVARNSNPTLLLGQIFSDIAFSILEERPLHFACTCSKERVSRALRLLGKDEINDMIIKDKGAEIHCDFCSKNYVYSVPELESLLNH